MLWRYVIFTARIRRMVVVPQPALDGGYSGQVLIVGGGVPQPGLDGGGVPWPGLDGGGVPGVLFSVCTWGTPPPWLDGVPPPARSGWWGVPPTMTGWGTPHHDWLRYPPIMTGLGTLPPLPWLDGGNPPPTTTTNIVSTCYAAGGMPLAFTQEDFLVFSIDIITMGTALTGFSSPSSISSFVNRSRQSWSDTSLIPLWKQQQDSPLSTSIGGSLNPRPTIN